jgi:uncharacterized delta-60 repeat protein
LGSLKYQASYAKNETNPEEDVEPFIRYQTFDTTILQPDGKFIIVGLPSAYNSESLVVIDRYNSDGTRDISFEVNGQRIYDAGATIIRAPTLKSLIVPPVPNLSAALQDNGKILIGFRTENRTSAGTVYNYKILRLNSDGTTDTSFDGEDGVVQIPLSSDENNINISMTLQPDGKIVVATKNNIYRYLGDPVEGYTPPTPNPTPIPTNSTFFDIDGSGGQPSFGKDSLLLSAYLFYAKPDRTDYSILDRFINDPKAARKTGNDINNYLKDKLAALDVDGSGQTSFSKDALLIAAYTFYTNPDRTDYSVLDRFINDPKATRKTGNDVAAYIKSLTSGNSAANYASAENLHSDDRNIIGTDGNDILTGNTANNFLVGGAGDDVLTGNEGKDTFSFGIDSGNDTITDFNPAEDLIRLDASLGFANADEALAAINYGGETELILGEGNRLTIVGEIMQQGALTVDNFIIV